MYEKKKKNKTKTQLPTADSLTGSVICSVFYSVSNKNGCRFVHTTLELFSDNIFLLKTLT